MFKKQKRIWYILLLLSLLAQIGVCPIVHAKTAEDGKGSWRIPDQRQNFQETNQ